MERKLLKLRDFYLVENGWEVLRPTVSTGSFLLTLVPIYAAYVFSWMSTAKTYELKLLKNG